MTIKTNTNIIISLSVLIFSYVIFKIHYINNTYSSTDKELLKNYNKINNLSYKKNKNYIIAFDEKCEDKKYEFDEIIKIKEPFIISNKLMYIKSDLIKDINNIEIMFKCIDVIHSKYDKL